MPITVDPVTNLMLSPILCSLLSHRLRRFRDLDRLHSALLQKPTHTHESRDAVPG